MIPIVSILNALSGLLCIGLFWHLWRQYKTRQNLTIKYFSMFYLYFFFFLFLAAIPGLISKNGFVIASAAVIGYFLLFIAVAYLLNIALTVYKHSLWKQWAFSAIISIGAILFVLNLVVIAPAVAINAPPFVYYLVQEYSILRILEGIAPLLIGMIVAGMLIREGWLLSHKPIQINTPSSSPALIHRSYTIATGLIILILAGIFNYIVFAFIPSGPTFLVSAVLANLSLIVIFKGIET